MPRGSEGSVQYRIIKNNYENSHISYGDVLIWGDLRDYSDVDAIYKWIVTACDGLFIRSCSVKVDVEFDKSYLIYDYYDEVQRKTLIKMMTIE